MKMNYPKTLAFVAFFAMFGGFAAHAETQDESVVSDPVRTELIESWMKTCLGTLSTPAAKATWTKKEINDYCGCGSVTMADRTTNEQYDTKVKTGNFSPDWWTMREEVRVYCIKKYMKTPDVSDIKNKKW